MLFKNIPVDWPLDSNVIRRNSEINTFGMVRFRADGSRKPHQGWDFYAPKGTACYSISDGEVVFADPCGDYGNTLVVTIAGTPLFAAYAHLDEILVPKGAKVTLGQRIAYTGCTGNADKMTGADQHLHFEIRDLPTPGMGLDHRYSPLTVFGVCPMTTAALREGLKV